MKEILIVGAGLSGLTAAYLIKSTTDANVTIIEKGVSYLERLSSDNPNMLNGVGGAGTVGGGKLCFPPASSEIWRKTGFTSSNFRVFWDRCITPFFKEINGIDITLKNTVNHVNILGNGTYEKKYASILLSKNEMNQFVTGLVEKALSLGTLIYTNCDFRTLEYYDFDSYIVSYLHEGEYVRRKYDVVLFASGRSSANSLFSWLPERVKVTNKYPDLGLRFSLENLNNHAFSDVGKDVKIKTTIGDISARTFCVCSGGNKTLISMGDFQYYDGHYGDKITETSNLGLLARSPKLTGYKYAALYCNYLNKYLTSAMTLSDFVKHWNILIPETSIFDEVLCALATFVQMLQSNMMLPGNLDQCPVFLPSVDNLNAIIETNQSFETCCPNLYVIGDACGISRGFIQSMWSAHCACADIISKLNHTITDIHRLKAI